MKQVVENSQCETTEKLDTKALRSGSRAVAEKPALADDAVRVNDPKTLRARLKTMLANVAKALEGDHEIHKYRS